MLSAEIRASNGKWAKKNEPLYNEAIDRLASYLSGSILPSEVFNNDLYARYIVISVLMCSRHNLRWLNLRFYYNPETKKFEPVAFDCYDVMDPRNKGIWFKEKKQFEYFLHPLLDDPVFRLQVDKYLKIYCSAIYVKKMFSNNHGDIAKYQKLIMKDKPNYMLSRNQILKRAKHILSTLE